MVAIKHVLIEKKGHNILELSIWRYYGNKERYIPTEANKPYVSITHQ